MEMPDGYMGLEGGAQEERVEVHAVGYVVGNIIGKPWEGTKIQLLG